MKITGAVNQKPEDRTHEQVYFNLNINTKGVYYCERLEKYNNRLNQKIDLCLEMKKGQKKTDLSPCQADR